MNYDTAFKNLMNLRGKGNKISFNKIIYKKY